MGDGSDWPSTATSLILRLQSDADNSDWSLFVEIYTPLIRRYCSRRGIQASDAEDVTQDVLQHLTRQFKAAKFDPSLGRFRGWLGTITRHAMYDFIQRRRKAGQGAGGHDAVLKEHLASEDSTWLEEFNATIYEAAISRVRCEVDANSWQVFEQVWTKQQKPSDVAMQLGINATDVYKIKYSILKQLRMEVEYLTSDAANF